AAQATRQSAATRATVSPAAGLAAALRGRGVDVTQVPYQPDEAESVLDGAMAAAASADVLMFASTARTVLRAGEVALVRALAAGVGGAAMGGSTAFVHVALWNPYLVASVPGPALVTFGWRERSVKAAAAALLGEVRAT